MQFAVQNAVGAVFAGGYHQLLAIGLQVFAQTQFT
jgi:hypothetical protein